MADNILDYEDLKKRGFLRQRQEGLFVLRARMSAGIYQKEHLRALAGIAEKYGMGSLHATTRQGLEVPFIKFEDIPAVERALEEAGINRGASGARMRTIVSCPGNNWCRAGLVDTFTLCNRIERDLGIKCGLELPHKFKIAVSGCPNACTRPQHSDIGVHGQVDTSSPDKRIGYVLYIGGNGGRSPKAGFRLDGILSEEEVLSKIAGVVALFKDKARPRQRLGALVEETGKEEFLKSLMR